MAECAENRVSISETPIGVHKKGVILKKLSSFNFNNKYDNVKFTGVETTDYYRRGNPYKLFTNPSRSKVEISFNLKKTSGILKLVVILNQCATNCYGVVDMYLNGEMVVKDIKAAWANFGKETCKIDADKLQDGSNTLKIALQKTSPGVYWLSDATLSLEMDDSLKHRCEVVIRDIVSARNVKYLPLPSKVKQDLGCTHNSESCSFTKDGSNEMCCVS